MRMQRRPLQIDTNFLEQDDQSPKIHTFSRPICEEMTEAAEMIEKLLSMILARNFIQCWKQLKMLEGQPHRTRRIQPTVGKRGDKYNSYYQEDKCHSPSLENYVSTKPRSRSQAFINIKTERSLYGQDEEYRIKRNKSTRVINKDIESSRATILKDIVEKLKHAKKVSQSKNDDDDAQEVFKRIAHLQRMVRGIKNWNSSQIYQSYLVPSHQNSRSKPRQCSSQQQATSEQDELVKQFMDEIQIIRKEITEIKANNELILKAEMERSQASGHSDQRYRQLKTPRVDSKMMLTEGVQTIEKQPTFVEIQEKYKRLMEEASVLTKTTQITTHANSSRFGAVSATDSRESDKCILNQSNKNLGFSLNPILPKISTPLPMTQPSQFPQASFNTAGFAFKPSNITMSLPPPRPVPFPQQQQVYSYQSFVPGFVPEPLPQVTNTIITRTPSIYFQHPKFEQMKTTTTVFDNRSTTIDGLPSTRSFIGQNYSQAASFVQPKTAHVFLHEDTRRNITFTNYCSTCGRNCGCFKGFNDNRRF